MRAGVVAQGRTGSLGEAIAEIGGERRAGLGRARTHPQSADGAIVVERRGDVGEPLGLILIDPRSDGVADLVGERAGLVGPCRRLGGDDDGTQIAQIEVGHTGQRRVGTIVPLGFLQAGQQLLGQLHQGSGVDGRATFGLVASVLLVHGLADTGDATTKHLLGDGALRLGEARQRRVAMLAPWPEPLGLRLGRQRRLAGAVGPALTVAAAATTAVVVTATAATTLTVTTFAATAAAAASAAAVTIAATTAALGLQLGRHATLVAPRAEHLEPFRLLALALGGQDRGDLDPVDEELGFDPQFLADGCAVGQQRRRDDALGLPGANGAPGPGFVVSDGGQLDIDPA